MDSRDSGWCAPARCTSEDVRRAGKVLYLRGEVSCRSGKAKAVVETSNRIAVGSLTLQVREFGTSLGDIDRPTGSVFQTVN